MNLNGDHAANWSRVALRVLSGCAVMLALFTPRMMAQTPEENKPAESKPAEMQRVFFLQYATNQNDLNDIQTDLRNMYPRMKIFGVASQLAISVHGTPEDVESARKLLGELDRPRKTYRITYTLTTLENGQAVATERVTLIAASGERATLREGTKVPIATAASGEDAAAKNSQVQYIDVGLSIMATPDATEGGLQLRSKVEQSSVAEEKPGAWTPDPVIRQNVIDNTSSLAEGKPLVLGSIELAGSKRLEVQVVAERVK